MHSQKRNKGAIAQLVEQRTENPCVPGSIPGGTTKNHSKKMKTSEFQRIQRFSFCFNCAKHADLGISIVPNSWLFFERCQRRLIQQRIPTMQRLHLYTLRNETHDKAQCDRNDNRNKPFHTETFLLEEQMLQIKGFKFREEYRNAPLFSKCSFPDYTTIR